MSLSLALNNALSGLVINQQAIGVLSNNIANVNTAGYSKQIITQSALVVEGVGSGVRLDDIVRKIDKYIQRSVQTQSANYATASTLDSYYQNLQSFLGQPGSSNSVDTYITGFFNGLQQLAESPETSSLKSNAVSSGAALAKQLSDLAANIHDLRFEADQEISRSVDDINSSLDRLKAVNATIQQAKSLRQSTAGLLDQRDAELRKLSEYMNISTSFDESGAVTVVAGDGIVLLEDGLRHQLRYTRAPSVNGLVQNTPFAALEAVALNDDGQTVGNPVTMISAGTSSEVVSKVPGGKLSGLQQMRDVKFPAVLEQLDMLASRVRDEVNTLHNNGSGYPPATSLTGDRPVFSSDQYNWTGSVRIAVLKADGKPVPSGYADESYTGVRPLTLDLSRLDAGQGAGKPTLQTIINEINNHFGAPGKKAELGNLNNIQLASSTVKLPSGSPPLFDFDLDLDNISDGAAKVFVTDVTVRDDTATDITSYTGEPPSITINASGSYTTTAGSDSVTINLPTAPGVGVGDTIYLEQPSGAIDGIPAASLGGFFTVTAVSGNTVTFTAGATATTGGSYSDAGGMRMFPPYDTIAAGDKSRTNDNGELQVDFSGNPTSDYYDITVNVSVVEDDGTISSAPITYRVTNNVTNVMNKRYNVEAIGGAGTMVNPTSSQETLRAIMVDADGREMPKVNGQYVDGEGYLKIVANGTVDTYGVAIDELDSKQLGKLDQSPAEDGTNWGFSHYFGLNNFFASNEPSTTGDTVAGSAYYLKVQDRLLANANLITTGNLSLQTANADTNYQEIYTYARYVGDNSAIQQIAKLNSQLVSFDAAGGLSSTQLSLQGYTSDIMGFISQRSSEATDNAASAKVLYDGFVSKSESISGVNLDEELANTITFQNAYSATARVMSIVNDMYEQLLQAFG